MASPFTATGTVERAESGSLSVTPAYLTDIWVVAVYSGLSGPAISGGGVTTWHNGPTYNGYYTGSYITLFWGVITATTATTITITGGSPHETVAKEFTVTSGFAVSTDGVGGNTHQPAGTITWPSLTPTLSNGELYFGYGIQPAGGTITEGSTSGFTYNQSSASGDYAQVLWDANVTATAAPTATAATAGVDMIGMLLMAQKSYFPAPRPSSFVPQIRASHYHHKPWRQRGSGLLTRGDGLLRAA